VSSDRPERVTALAARSPMQHVWDDVPLQKLWLATQRREWRSLAVLAASSGVDTLPIAELLAQAAWAYRGQPSCVFDLRDLGLRLAGHQMHEVRAQMDAGASALIALRSTSENPTAVPVARQADAIILAIGIGKTRFKSAERTIAEVGRERVIGSIVVRPHGTHPVNATNANAANEANDANAKRRPGP
jgi:hypothetical protein